MGIFTEKIGISPWSSLNSMLSTEKKRKKDIEHQDFFLFLRNNGEDEKNSGQWCMNQ